VAEGYESRMVVLDCARDMHSPLPTLIHAHYEQSESSLNKAESHMPLFIMVGTLHVGHKKGLGP
jgi:hypothetical protein